MEDAPANGRELARSWQAVLGRLELELNPHNFATWLRGAPGAAPRRRRADRRGDFGHGV